MQNQKKGSEATGPLRSHQYFRSGTHLVLFFALSRKGNQKIGRKYMWEAGGME